MATAQRRARSRSLHAHITTADLQAELLQRDELLHLSAETGQSLLGQLKQLQEKTAQLEQHSPTLADNAAASPTASTATLAAPTATSLHTASVAEAANQQQQQQQQQEEDLHHALTKLRQLESEYDAGVGLTDNAAAFFKSPRKRTIVTPTKPKTPGKARTQKATPLSLSTSSADASGERSPAAAAGTFAATSRRSSFRRVPSVRRQSTTDLPPDMRQRQLLVGRSDSTLVGGVDESFTSVDDSSDGNASFSVEQSAQQPGLSTFQTIQEHNEFMTAMVMEARIRQQRIAELEAQEKRLNKSLAEKEYQIEDVRMQCLRTKESEAKYRAQLRHIEAAHVETAAQLKLIEESAARSAQENAKLNLAMQKMSTELEGQKSNALTLSAELASVTKELGLTKRKLTHTNNELEQTCTLLETARDEAETLKRRLAKARKIASQQAGQLRRLRKLPSKSDLASANDWSDQQVPGWNLAYGQRTPHAGDGETEHIDIPSASARLPQGEPLSASLERLQANTRFSSPAVSASPSYYDLSMHTPTPQRRRASAAETGSITGTPEPGSGRRRSVALKPMQDDTPLSASFAETYLADENSFAAQFQSEQLQAQFAKLMETISDLQSEKADWAEERSELLELLNASREEIEAMQERLATEVTAASANRGTPATQDAGPKSTPRRVAWRRGSGSSDASLPLPPFLEPKDRTGSTRSIRSSYSTSMNLFSLASELFDQASARSDARNSPNINAARKTPVLAPAAGTPAVGLGLEGTPTPSALPAAVVPQPVQRCDAEVQTDFALPEQPVAASAPCETCEEACQTAQDLPTLKTSATTSSQTDAEQSAVAAIEAPPIAILPLPEPVQDAKPLAPVALPPAKVETTLSPLARYVDVADADTTTHSSDIELSMTSESALTKDGSRLDSSRLDGSRLDSSDNDESASAPTIRHVYTSLHRHPQPEEAQAQAQVAESEHVNKVVAPPAVVVPVTRPDLVEQPSPQAWSSFLVEEGASIHPGMNRLSIVSEPSTSQSASTSGMARSVSKRSLAASIIDISPSWNADYVGPDLPAPVATADESLTEADQSKALEPDEIDPQQEGEDAVDDQDDDASDAMSVDSDLSVVEKPVKSTRQRRDLSKVRAPVAAVTAVASAADRHGSAAAAAVATTSSSSSTTATATGKNSWNERGSQLLGNAKKKAASHARRALWFTKKQKEHKAHAADVAAAAPYNAPPASTPSSTQRSARSPVDATVKDRPLPALPIVAATTTAATVPAVAAPTVAKTASAASTTTASATATSTQHISMADELLMQMPHMYSNPSAMADVAKVMVGQFFTKYDRTVRKHHQRYFWINAPKMMVYWSKDPPIEESSNNQFRSGVILDARLCSTGVSVQGRDAVTGRSTVTSSQFLIIHTKSRILHLQSQYPEDHLIWVRAITYLRERQEQRQEKGHTLVEQGLAQDCAQAADPTAFAPSNSYQRMASSPSTQMSTSRSSDISYFQDAIRTSDILAGVSGDRRDRRFGSISSSSFRNKKAGRFMDNVPSLPHSRSSNSIRSLMSSAFKSTTTSSSHTDISGLEQPQPLSQ
ncbi:hypothetical protein RI367_003606 [Sorochytrium milnesiophthora]